MKTPPTAFSSPSTNPITLEVLPCHIYHPCQLRTTTSCKERLVIPPSRRSENWQVPLLATVGCQLPNYHFLAIEPRVLVDSPPGTSQPFSQTTQCYYTTSSRRESSTHLQPYDRRQWNVPHPGGFNTPQVSVSYSANARHDSGISGSTHVSPYPPTGLSLFQVLGLDI